MVNPGGTKNLGIQVGNLPTNNWGKEVKAPTPINLVLIKPFGLVFFLEGRRIKFTNHQISNG